MTGYTAKQNFRHDDPSVTGVILVNLGSPEAPTRSAVRRYLGEFLWDPRVVEVPRWLWWMVLNLVILNVRPGRSAASYRKVWTESGSPLIVLTTRLAEALGGRTRDRYGDALRVVPAMRYGSPSIRSALQTLREDGADRILVLPLYPQYSATTTASVFDAVTDELKQWRWLPELRFVGGYADDPAYIHALASSVEAYRAANGSGDRLLFSFHGIPQRYFRAGDPYHCQCHKTARLVAEALDLDPARWQVAFQSRFGREPWLSPYTDHTLKALPGEGVSRVDVVCPGFSIDCLETLEEIDMQNREIYLAAGGREFHYIPALNDSAAHVDALGQIIDRQLLGWPIVDGKPDPEETRCEASRTRERAVAMGAAE